MARILSIDYGHKRTGIAVTDELQIIASGLTTVPTNELMSFLKDYVNQESVEFFVIGKPLQMNSEVSESEIHISTFIKKLKKEIPNIPIQRIDERFTSKLAFQT
ncbi:MAG: Holliday junction resolvase RuvX, partial [Bacteroidia bacterium]|nr:Holliday junction resolvase RuvX [Bacteroidia bacterium]